MTAYYKIYYICYYKFQKKLLCLLYIQMNKQDSQNNHVLFISIDI